MKSRKAKELELRDGTRGHNASPREGGRGPSRANLRLCLSSSLFTNRKIFQGQQRNHEHEEEENERYI